MDHPIEIVGEPIAGQSATLRKRMLTLAADLTQHTFDLAEALLQAQDTHCYAEWGFATLGEYAEQELGLKARKSQYLARICRVCKECGIKRADYEPVGVTKLRLITSLDPGDTYFNPETRLHEPLVEHITDLIAEGPELSTQEIEERVAHLKGMDGGNAMITKSYSVTKDCYENTIKRCFESLRMRMGSKCRDGAGTAVEYSDGAVLEMLCAEWNGDPRNFMEETDCSKDQIEVPLEENNGRHYGVQH
jgi:hypothetical protein